MYFFPSCTEISSENHRFISIKVKRQLLISFRSQISSLQISTSCPVWSLRDLISRIILFQITPAWRKHPIILLNKQTIAYISFLNVYKYLVCTSENLAFIGHEEYSSMFASNLHQHSLLYYHGYIIIKLYLVLGC